MVTGEESQREEVPRIEKREAFFETIDKVVTRQVVARYATAINRKDLLSVMPDGNLLFQPKAPLPSSITRHWPPDGYHDPHTRYVYRPPNIQKPGPFRVIGKPDLVSHAYESVMRTKADRLNAPFPQGFKNDWVVWETMRLDELMTCSEDWQMDEAVEGVDNILYASILRFFADMIGTNAVILNMRDTPISVTKNDRDYVVHALGRGGSATEGCILVRFLQVADLDVCEDIQHLASQEPFFEPEHQWLGKRRRKTPRRMKAKAILKWVFYAARQDRGLLDGSCNYIKLGDGWNNIWFYVHDGVVEVGPTMTPQLSDAPGPEASFGLTHAFLAFTVAAGAERSKALAKEEAQKASSRDENIRVPDEAGVTSNTTQEQDLPPQRSLDAQLFDIQPARRKRKTTRATKTKSGAGRSSKPQASRVQAATFSGPRRQSTPPPRAHYGLLEPSGPVSEPNGEAFNGSKNGMMPPGSSQTNSASPEPRLPFLPGHQGVYDDESSIRDGPAASRTKALKQAARRSAESYRHS